MPIIKSAIKRAKQAETRRSRNLKVLSAVRTDTKVALATAKDGDKKATETALRAAISEIDRAVKKGTFHKNTAARKKSRLVKAVVKLNAEPAKAAPKPATKKPAATKTAKK